MGIAHAFLCTTLLLGTSAFSADLWNSSFLKKVDACAAHADNKKPLIVLIKQWHLSATVNTKNPSKEFLPQAANQTEIYQQLEAWVQAKKIDTVIAEGCEGEINSKFTPQFNGWNYADLKAASSKKDYAKIPSHVVLKLEAKFNDQVASLCGDKLGAIKKEQLAFSDSRADLGYLSKLMAVKNIPTQEKLYREGAIDALKLKPDATTEQVMQSLKSDLKETITKIKAANKERNQAVADKASDTASKLPVPVIFGGAHVAELKLLLEKQGMNCVVLEPNHYQNDEEKLMQSLDAMVSAL